jgi:hypothetical protein
MLDVYRHQPLLYVGVTFDSSSGRAGVYMYCPIRGCNLRGKKRWSAVMRCFTDTDERKIAQKGRK